MPEPIKTALSLAAALLFLWSAVWCIRRVFSPEPAPHYTEPSSRSRCWAAIAGTAFILVLHLIFAVTAHINYPEADFRQAIEWQFYGNTDPRHYLDLSIYGYGTQEAFPEQYLQIVFFPLYPALLHILHFVTRIDAFWLGFAVQLPLFAAATASFYTVIARRWDEQTAALSLALLLASPASVFFAVPMTESLFLLLTVRYVLTLEREQWWRCASLGVLAGLCRAPGGLLLGLTGLYLFMRWRRGTRPTIPSLLAMLSPAAGLGLYFLLNYLVYGRWNQYQIYQWDNWNQKLGLFTNTVRYHLDYMAQWWDSNPKSALALCLAAVLCLLTILALLSATVRRLPAHWLGFGLAYFDGYHLADQRPAVRSGAVLPARCLGAAFAGPPTAHKGCTGNAGYRKRYLHNAISIRLAYLLKNCLSPKYGDRQFFDSAISYFFCSAPCSMMSPKDSALYRPTLLAWRAMRSGRGLLSSVESNTMWTLSATSTPFSFLVESTCR